MHKLKKLICLNTILLSVIFTSASDSLQAEPAEVQFPRTAIVPVAIGENVSPAETAAFAAILESLRNGHETSVLNEVALWLDTNANNSWAAALRANLGMVYLRSGRFSCAIDEWELAWTASKEAAQGTEAYYFANRVAAELAGLYSRLGRVSELSELMSVFETRPLEGIASRRFESAKAAMASMLLRPEGAFKCGPYAMQTILRHNGVQTPLQAELIAQADSTPQGFNLSEVSILADQLGMNLQMAFREPGSPLPLPAVAHWRSNHYAAIIIADDYGWVADDPTFQRRIHFTESALDHEASGYFLIPEGPLQQGWRIVSEQEAEAIFGRGAPDDTSEEDSCSEDSESGGNCNGGTGMPVYSFSTFHAALIIRDTPIVLQSPVGRSIPFTITYNHRSSEDESHVAAGLLSSKWTHNWRVYLEKDTSGSVSSWRLRTATNRSELYQTEGSQANDHHISRARLVPASGSEAFPTRELPDGSIQVFGHEVEIIGGPDLFYLTELIDPQGNSIILSYDSNDRLTTIQDALGREVTLIYNDTPEAGDPDSIHRIRAVVLEDEREALFSYTDGMLISVTDMAGMTSTFSYQDSYQSDFITQMETPYGATEFERLEYEGYFTGPGHTGTMVLRHGVEATNPLGQKERIEFSFDYYYAVGFEIWQMNLFGMGMGWSEVGDFSEEHWILNTIPSAEIPPSQLMTTNRYFPSEGTTVYWDFKTYREFPPDPDTGKNYSKGIQTHWLRDRNNKDIAVPIRSSVKRPLENRIWYRYEDQLFLNTNPLHAGVTAQPIQIGRVVEDNRFESAEMEYNSAGQMTRFIDPEGRETEYVFAANGIDLLEIRQKVGSGWETQLRFEDYNNHLPGKMIDGSGNETIYQYNTKGQLFTVTNPLLETTSYIYHNQPTYDLLTDTAAGYGYLVAIKGPDDQLLQSIGYDDAGRAIWIRDSEGHLIEIEYDDLDRQKRVTYPDDTFEEWEYYRLDIASYKDREGRKTDYLYNSLGQLMVMTDPEGRITQYDYCTCGDIKAIIDANGNTTRWRFDIQGRITKKIYPDNTESIYHYYPTSGRLESITDALAQTTHYSYHLDNNLDTISYTGAVHATPSVSHTWDPAFNRLESITDGIGTITWTYHPHDGSTLGAGQVASVVGPFTDSTIAYAYDELNRRTGRTINGTANALTRDFDALGRLETETNPLGTFDYHYLNETNQISRIDLPGGHSTHFGYRPNNEDRRLERIEHRRADQSILAAHGYQYSADGIITHWQQERSGHTDRTWHFGYDAADQLTSATLKDPQEAVLQSLAWQYDPAGNRIAEEKDASGLIPSRHNGLNQLTEHGGGPIRFAGTIDEPGKVWVAGHEARMRNMTDFEAWLELSPGTHPIDITAEDYSDNSITQTFAVHIADEGQVFLTYDLNGNLLTRISNTTVTTYEWDAANRLIAIEVEGETRSEFLYDGISRRVGITESAWNATTEDWQLTTDYRYLWDDLTIAEQRSGVSGETVEKRFFPQGVEIVTGPESATYTYRTDHLGSIREVVDASGNLAARFDYSPWGEIETVSGSFDLDFGFTGHFIHQPTGLYLAPFRAYDAGLGRWLSRDPLGFVDGPNLYGYVRNDPISYFDPDGQSAAHVARWSVGNVYNAGATGVSAYRAWRAARQSAAAAAAAVAALEAARSRHQCEAAPVIDCPGSTPPFVGEAGTTVRGKTQTRTYGPDGYPTTDRDWPHADHAPPGNSDHVHDWGRPEGGGRPTNDDRGPGRDPRPGDPPAPRGP